MDAIENFKSVFGDEINEQRLCTVANHKIETGIAKP